jgi:hypothetical protein
MLSAQSEAGRLDTLRRGITSSFSVSSVTSVVISLFYHRGHRGHRGASYLGGNIQENLYFISNKDAIIVDLVSKFEFFSFFKRFLRF